MTRDQWQQLCTLLATAADFVETHGDTDNAETFVSALDVAQGYRNAALRTNP